MTRLRPAGNYVPVLVVLPTDVMNAADGGPVSERAVRPVPVVVVEPVWQRLVALSMCAVDDPVGPLPGHRLVEALDLPVRARPVGLGRQVADPLAGEQLAQRAVLGVGEGVIAHQPPRSDAVALVEGECSLEEAGHGRCPLVAMELDIGEARVVVDDRVRKVVADQPLGVRRLAPARGAVSGDRVTGPLEAGVAADVDVQQVAGARPLVAVGRLPWRARGPGDAGPLEHLPDRRVREACDARDQPRPPARLPPASADPLLQLGRELARAAARSARAIKQTRKARARLLARPAPAMPPAVRGRRRDTEGRRGGLHAHSPFNFIPPSIAWTSASRPASPSLALR